MSNPKGPKAFFATVDENNQVNYQGFLITPPASPSGPGQFVTSPTPIQTVVQTSIQTSPGSREDPPTYVTVQAQFYWYCVYQAEAQANPDSQSVSVTTGVTSSDSTTLQFASSIGAEISEGFGPISAKLNASFTQTTGITTTISLNSSTTTQNNYSVGAETTGQNWQLYQVFNIPNVVSLASQENCFLSLSYPA